MFENDMSGWVQRAKIVPTSDYNTQFGLSVAMSGDRIVIGDSSGAAYVFEQIGAFWAQIATLDDGLANGTAQVDVDDQRVVVGLSEAPGPSGTNGAVAVYQEKPHGWEYRMLIQAPDGTSSFAHSVALAGDKLAAGTFSSDDAYLFSSIPNDPSGYGVGCKGSGGFVPELTLTSSPDGCLFAGDSVSFSITNALGGSAAVLLLGLGQAQVPVSPECSLLLTPAPVSVVLPLLGTGPGDGVDLVLVDDPYHSYSAVHLRAGIRYRRRCDPRFQRHERDPSNGPVRPGPWETPNQTTDQSPSTSRAYDSTVPWVHSIARVSRAL